MNFEIERKFLVKDDSWKEGLTEADSSFIKQAYLTVYPEPTVRIRIRDSHAWLAVKGMPDGIGRAEFEYEVPVTDALELMKLAKPGLVLKRRYEIEYQGKKWEVDEFLGENEGLMLAEIELDEENETFESPSWLGDEVSFDSRYKNAALAMNPVNTWK